MKRIWYIHLPNKNPFAMIVMDGAVDEAGALREARLIWPSLELVS